MAKAQVTHAECGGVHVLRYSGKVDYMSAPAIRRFLDDLLDRGNVTGLIFDLSDAEALDSTNLGLLARIHERAERCHCNGSMIVSHNEDINCVLRSMGFEQIFDIVNDPRALDAACSDYIDASSPSTTELRDTMIEAHRALMRLSENGREQFADVVACLESEPTSH
jgi:anti-anti-sigma factor